ncbi:colicin V synthesis protein [Pantoea deleyi]|uniref:Colicin V synthesis protein n=1 Tax=Pantoea deleyi TaxID=470932 RepID=A0A506QZ65_9GAMM|nr:colicin V synthesis protein [Pantoea deleyi]ORM81585.1 colicin V synthesis protein [Pantoea deleyi]TPV49978.1 colicin V synthesis protein [Pantoea deleyi]
MRDLNMMEIEAVSGAGFWSAFNSAILGAVGAGSAGAIIGGMHGGDGGGILGVGAIGQLVGMLGGGLIGVVAGSVGGWIVGWSDPATVIALVTQFFSNASSGLFHNGPAAK